MPRRLRARVWALALITTATVLLTLGAAPSRARELHAFLTIELPGGETLRGDSQLAGYEGWIEIDEVAHEVFMARDEKGAPTGVEGAPLVVVTRLGGASAKLFELASRGAKVPSLELALLAAEGGAGPQELVRVELAGVVIDRLQLVDVSGTPAVEQDPLPRQRVSFRYEQMTWTFVPLRRTSTWDLKGGAR